jgi:hypothetical protein
LTFRSQRQVGVRRGHVAHPRPENSAFCQDRVLLSRSLSASMRPSPFPVHMDLAKPCTRRAKTSLNSRRFENTLAAHATQTVSTSWLSFGTARRREFAPSHFERGLKPARPGLSLGVFRRFGTLAYFHVVASPNEVQLSATLYYRIKIASRKNGVHSR